VDKEGAELTAARPSIAAGALWTTAVSPTDWSGGLTTTTDEEPGARRVVKSILVR
jgi:hypothetical protein